MSGGGLFRMGRSQAKRYDEAAGSTRVTFADVAGIDEAKGELVEIVEFLKEPARFTRLGAVHRKGSCLLVLQERQNASGASGRRRSWCAVLQHGRQRIC